MPSRQPVHRPSSDAERVVRLDASDGSPLALIVIDSTRLGPAFGGIRRVRYTHLDAALADAHKLARAMTHKCALAGLPAGGAKAVVLDRPGLDCRETYRRLGELIESLGGSYVCGPDIGTGVAELAWVRETSTRVNPVPNDPSRATALGVYAGLRAALRVRTGSDSTAGRTVVVQGIGGVGTHLCRMLMADGARVLGIEIDRTAAARAQRLGVSLLDAWQGPEWPEVPCDIFAPCALGGVLTDAVAQRLAARTVCGSANNPLSAASVGRALHERGVLVAPDVVVTAGAVIEGVLSLVEGESASTRARVDEALSRIEVRCEAVLREALVLGVPPGELAAREAERLLGYGG